MDAVAREGAAMVESGAKERVSVRTGKLRDAIHIERKAAGEYDVVAGDSEAFYGHIVEHGSVHTPPRPFLVPAGEEAKREIRARAATRLKAL